MKLEQLPKDVIRCVLVYFDGIGLEAVAIAVPRVIGDVARDEIARRERCRKTLKAKAEAFGECVGRLKWLKRLDAGDELPPFNVQTIVALHRTIAEYAIKNGVELSELSASEGFRTGAIAMIGSNHKPPPSSSVKDLVIEMCSIVDSALKCWSMLPSSITQENEKRKFVYNMTGFVYWRMTWIHPFRDANGRLAHLAALLAAFHSCEPPRWGSVVGVEHYYLSARMETSCQFLEHRRQEIRALLVDRLRIADKEWGRLELSEQKRFFSKFRKNEVTECDWLEGVGKALVQEVWKPLATSLEDFAPQGKTQVYRWINDVGGGDYSTGITSTPSSDTSPTWISSGKNEYIQSRYLDETHILQRLS